MLFFKTKFTHTVHIISVLFHTEEWARFIYWFMLNICFYV